MKTEKSQASGVPRPSAPAATAPRGKLTAPSGYPAGGVRLLLRLTMCLLVLVAAIAQARSVTITPNNASIGLGKTVQFSAGSATGVVWSVAGKVGGNATSGTITSGGLYTAPSTMPGQNPVQVTATVSGASASVYVDLLGAGPTISSVSPNPLKVGSYTVTIAGSGFLPGATVANLSNGVSIQLQTSSVGANQVVAVGYQGAAPNATFTVRNPGSEPSNAITVPVVSSGGGTYKLTVVNGSGSGTYAAGASIAIAANAPPSGQSFVNWTGATVQNPNAATTTLTMPASNVTVTANYTGPATYALTVNNGSGSGSYAAGTVVTIAANAPPANNVFAGWTGATVADPTSATTTLTMPAQSVAVTASYKTAPQIPFPVTTHPRLWITPRDLPRLRSWAVASNPVYGQGIAVQLQNAINIYNTQFFPGGVQNLNWPDPGDSQGYVGYLTEQYAFVFAFNSLIDPNPTNRIKYAQYARNLIMVAMNEAAKGALSGAPFRDPLFATYNRANGSGEQWPLVVDWIYSATDQNGNPILTASDKLTIRNVFLQWAKACLGASTTGGDSPQPEGVTNSWQLLPGKQAYRFASNNYYLGHARLLTMMALAIDPSDDPLLDSTQPASTLGNTLRSYILDANGAWLYQMYAMMGDPAGVASDYGLGGAGTGLGLASGGLPPEGMLYGHSFSFVLGQLLALQTAGFNDPTLSGPQIHLIGSPVWDRFVQGFLSSLTPTAATPPSETWLGPVYQYVSYGDLLRLYLTPDFMQPFALLALLEQQQGLNGHADAARWVTTQAVQGSLTNMMGNITRPWSTTESALYFLLLDPTASYGADPRPAYPTVFVDPGAGRIVAHSDWTSKGTMFAYRASWESINHQDGDGGQFDFFRHGEWLTKEMSNYDNNAVGLTTYYHNTLGIQNWCSNGTPNLQWWEAGEWANGSQWMIGENAGDPKTVTSSGPGYVFASSDLTNLYNRPNQWTPSMALMDVTQATRSILWLNNDDVVIYDRATTNHSGLFKTFNLSLQNAPALQGAVATETLASGQSLYVQTLLPQSPTLSAKYVASNLSPIAELEPTRYVLTVQDASNPADVRFLHVLQGADAGVAMVPATYATSTSGALFDGAVFGGTAVFFPHSATAPIGTTTFALPSSVHTLIVTGLTPGASYTLTTQAGPTGPIVTLTPGGTGVTADSAGLVRASL